MTWRTEIGSNPVLWRATQEYCDQRIGELAAICTSSASSDLAIRKAQAAIEELERLVNLPLQLATEAKARGQQARKEY